MSERPKNLKLAGRSICEGLAIGKVFVYRETVEALAGSYGIQAHEVKQELQRIERATEAVAEDLRASARRIEAETDARLAAVFQAHEAMLKDASLRREIRRVVEEELIRAEHAVARVLRGRENKFREMRDKRHRRHADDVADLSQRMLREMAGIKMTALERMPRERVLVAARLLPSDTVVLRERMVAGIVVEFGGPASHVALLAEALGIPTVTQVTNLVATVREGDSMLVDGTRGEVMINPDAVTQEWYSREQRAARRRWVQLTRSAREQARTRGGVVVQVLANVSRVDDVELAVRNGADGVGLCRLEGLYLSRRIAPTAAELLEELRAMFKSMQEKPLTIRLLDIGGDKPLPFLSLPHDGNPLLGQRGVRVLLRYPELLGTQLQALASFSQEQDVRILVPMVTFASELATVHERLEAASRDAGQPNAPPLGAMIETPAAALSLAEIGKEAKFLSIGTNDLTQYTFAADRENPLVSDYFRDAHPALLRLLGIIIKEAGDLPVAVCGELARHVEAIPTLLRLGIRTLSVAAPLVPVVKNAIREANV